MKLKKMLRILAAAMVVAALCCAPAFAAGDVASAVESTWTDAATQIKTVVENVVFPALDMVLAIAFFTKLGMAYFDYKKHGQFEWTGPVILLPGGGLLRQDRGGDEQREHPLPPAYQPVE